MSYELPFLPSVYTWRLHDFGAGGLTAQLRGPLGRTGIVKHISIAPTETFTNATTPGYVRLGTAGDNDLYAELDCGTAAASTVFDSSVDDDDAIKGVFITADTLCEVNFVAPTGGTPAGIADVYIHIDWV